MKKIKHIIIIAAFSLLGSCNFLDLDPQDFVASTQYFNTQADLETALTGVYSTLHSKALYADYMMGRIGMEGDEGFDNRSVDVNTVSQYYVTATDDKILRFWQDIYAGINNANVLLENVDKPEIAIDKAVRERIKGEALFLRGYCYFLLVTNFGDVPYITKSVDSPKKEDLEVARTPSKEVYKSIIADMMAATEMVSDIKTLKYGGRVSKSAVWGVLARVHLHMAGEPLKETSHYKDARDCALKVMDSQLGHSLNPDFQQVFKNYATDVYDIAESIWEVEFSGNGVGIYANLGGFVGNNNGIRNNEDMGIGKTYEFINSTKYTYSVYKAGDLRRDYTVAPFRYEYNKTTQTSTKKNFLATELFNRNCGKFRREYETLTPKHPSRTPQNFPLLRYSDVLLMFAEAENEVNSGPNDAAYAAVNQVVRRGYGKDQLVANATIDWKDMDYTTFKKEIMDERTRELAFESLRKNDLIRWGTLVARMTQCFKDANAAPSFGDLALAKQAFGNVTSKNVIWPIPSYEMGVNSKLTQNPGW